MKDLARFLLDAANSGVYLLPKAGTIPGQAMACGLAWLELDLAGVDDKAGFLARCQESFKLPSSFGYNWDALADSIEDLSWLPARGCVVYCRNGGRFARHSPQDFSTALAILGAAAAYWRTKARLFLALLDAETGSSVKPEPPLLPA